MHIYINVNLKYPERIEGGIPTSLIELEPTQRY